MFVLVQRTDTAPETRVLVNTEHIVAALPVSGGVRTELHLAGGASWEISLSFAEAVSLLCGEDDASGG